MRNRTESNKNQLMRLAGFDEPQQIAATYIVVVDGESVFESGRIDCAIAFRRGRRAGAVYRRVLDEPLEAVNRIGGG